MRRAALLGIGFMLLVSGTTGCAVNFAKRSPWDIQKLAELSDQLDQFKTLAQLKAEEADQLRRAKGLMESGVGAEANIGYDERGLVTRLLDQVLFDSGKAELPRRAYSVLDKVARVLKEFPNQPIGVEGHTDDQPIKVSGWASNKALSIARAQAVADYLSQRHNIRRSQITTVGHGEEQPIADNATKAGRQQNRRVEIVMLPQASEGAYRADADAVNSNVSFTK